MTTTMTESARRATVAQHIADCDVAAVEAWEFSQTRREMLSEALAEKRARLAGGYAAEQADIAAKLTPAEAEFAALFVQTEQQWTEMLEQHIAVLEQAIQKMSARVMVSKTARVSGWGSDRSARRVTHLTPNERNHIRAGGTVLIEGCPDVGGITTRRVVASGRAFYARMPK